MSMGLCSLLLTACSRTVQWEEEVSLNTGETIWVKRSGTYTFKPAPGSPLDYGWGGDPRSTIEFTYKGKTYAHTDDVGLILLAIAPDGTPNLVTLPSTEWGWKHKYYCVTPYYVQFRPNSSGKDWAWPERLEPWLYDLPTNLMFGLAPLGASGKRFSAADRVLANAKAYQEKEYRNIDPNYSSETTCPRKK